MIFQNTQSPSPNFYYKNVLLTETKEYNFLGNVIDFKEATQELSKKGLKVLFSLSLHLFPLILPRYMYHVIIALLHVVAG